ncbi:MAG: recombinase family protein [Paracoccaceae bacterium]
MPAHRRIGYIRVSTREQVTDRQVLRLEADCETMRIEYLSAVAADRPVFDQLIAELRPGDVMVVVDLDRAFRSSIDAMLTADLLRRRGIRLDVLSLPIDTTTAEGELFYTMVAAVANFERRIISRRTKEGLEAARKRGVKLGRPGVLAPETIRAAHAWIAETDLPCRYVAALLGVSRLTLQRSFRRQGLVYPMESKDHPPL